MLYFEILILAIVQGIAEFLPISSSGHVVVTAELFAQCGYPLKERITVNIVLHLGTLLAIVAFYFRRIIHLLRADRRVIGLILVGTIPAVVVGLPLRMLFERGLESALLAGFLFPVTGMMLFWGDRHTSGTLQARDLTYGKALVIGLFQAAAILPGISRSGSTIVGGLLCGLRRDEAAALAFLLAIPAIGGAGVLEALHLFSQPAAAMSVPVLALGGVLSTVVGYVSLAWLVRWLQQGHLHWFAWWVIPLGPTVIVWQLLAG